MQPADSERLSDPQQASRQQQVVPNGSSSEGSGSQHGFINISSSGLDASNQLKDQAHLDPQVFSDDRNPHILSHVDSKHIRNQRLESSVSPSQQQSILALESQSEKQLDDKLDDLIILQERHRPEPELEDTSSFHPTYMPRDILEDVMQVPMPTQEYLKEIKQLQGQNKRYRQQINQLTQEKNQLEEKLDEKSDTILRLKEDNTSLRAHIQDPFTGDRMFYEQLEKIKALEEYCLNVDYLRFPVPPALNYLFVKTTGTCEFYDNNPPVDRGPGNGNLVDRPVIIDRSKKVKFDGDLINGKPGGNGTIDYGKQTDENGTTYSCTYTGTFLNGMKHGKGQLEVKGKGSFASIFQQRYTYDKKDGIFVIRYDDGRETTTVYEQEKRSFVRKFVEPGNKNIDYIDMKDDLFDGLRVDCYLDQRVLIRNFRRGQQQGNYTSYSFLPNVKRDD